MIGIIDYGLGNIRAFERVYNDLNFPTLRVKSEDELKKVTHIILPGVSSFDLCLKKLRESGLEQPLNKEVKENKKFILGVCVGMQIMGKTSEEGDANGLGWIPGKVIKLPSDRKKYRVPHIGWNKVKVTRKNWLDVVDNKKFYFLHSYYFLPEQKINELASTKFSVCFSSAISIKNIFGVQFHPEKSFDAGRSLLKSFGELSSA
ncbi:imidazole glycerol phosphate synthase subunit HisH [Alphaproteobacteria bacterium]|nr:imidazole glycerol phosphate synthase subunit HisH [Alphaproteobacteria bacterium]